MTLLHDDSQSSDSAAIAASIAEPSTFADVFERHYDIIFAYAAGRLGWSQAADIASETFLVAFATRRKFDEQRGSVRAWLFGIATNLIRNLRRREARRLRILAAQPGAIAQAELGETEVLSTEVRAAFEQMTQQQRDIVWLVDVMGLSYVEAAEALAVPLGTVQSRLSRARVRLADLLSEKYQSGV